ncbi:MAG TPA: radical SAM protein [Verrucomicrobia bacterium]|nr:MAG: hypothetical protein A2X46_08805 [Lentisphaerae bacterium GWF2_57_35]HBA82739.1 radical SAM protein [Verrucomicrobiota bacterium]
MIVLVNPNLVVQRNDPFTTGIVYMPIGLAYTAAVLREKGLPLKVIDAFAENPYQTERKASFLILGLKSEEVIARLPQNTVAVWIYGINLTSHIATLNLVSTIKLAYPKIPVIVLENTQAVTAYSLSDVADAFFAAGADACLTGESELRAVELAQLCLSGEWGRVSEIHLDGLCLPNKKNVATGYVGDLDLLPYPAWDLFPIENYWNLCFSHGPLSARRYLPLLTSRGCPYTCRFCVAPQTNHQRWRPRSAQNIVLEMERAAKTYGVYEFHIEDLNPTVSEARIRELCHLIIQRQLKVAWKIAAGTKIETIKNLDTLDLMAAAGCRYISISPESGSSRVLRLMGKFFDFEHAVRAVRRMNKLGISSQACFVLGFPGEENGDREQTLKMVREMTREGVDEIALFIITPVPGSAIFSEFSGYGSLSELNFTPSWRKDYQKLNRFRVRLYLLFLIWKLRWHPKKLFQQPFRFLRKCFHTKMEMVPYRAMVFKRLDNRAARR